MRRKTPADYHLLAKQRGFRWLGPEVPTVITKTGWECEQGHRWEAHYNSIQQRTGCPVCAGKVPKTPADYHALAEKRGFHWLGPEVSNTKIKTAWECEQGHNWEAPYSSIRQGKGCPICAGKTPKTPADYHALAEKRGFHWLGPEVLNTKTKTTWECEQGHRWKAPYHSIQQGSGCPVCAGKAPKTPADYHALAKARNFRWLGPEVPNANTKTTWVCEQGHRWEARYGDIQQGHGCPVCAAKAPKAPADYHALAEERGIRWLGPEVPNTDTKTGWECEQGHRWETPYSYIRQGTACPVCAGSIPKTPTDYHALAQEKGFHWLGPEVPTVITKTGWECEQGHRWEAQYNNIQQGSGCPICAIERQAAQRRKKPADYHALAEERSFRWLGPKVSNSHTKTNWECEQSHRWEATYHAIQQGRGCPVCVDIVHGAQVSQVQRELCEILNGELNCPFGHYRIDVALNFDGVAIAIEYDSWFWHGHNQDYDVQRDEELIAGGWRVLRIKSNELLPPREQLDTAIARLLAGENQVEIVLEDWGKGQTRFETD
jgi:very-short-patch-repair endonuclease